MSLMFTCDDKATLVAYLYDEIDASDRARVEEHLARCVACAAEAGALSGVRTQLTQWAPPMAELGFTVVAAKAAKEIVRADAATAAEPAPPATVLRPAQWWNTVPVWAQAVAAIFVLAVSAAVANVQIKSGPDGIQVSTGWMTPAANSAAVAPAASADSEQWKTALVALEQQLREEIRTTKETGTVRVASRSEGVDAATLRSVRDLLAASESKQNRELAFRMTQLMSDINVQRRADLLRVEQAIGNTSVEMARQQQRLNYVIRASTTPQQ